MKTISFADYTNLFCCRDNLEEFLDAAGSELNQFRSPFDLHKLALNLNKATCIIFGNRKLLINDAETKWVSEIKFLGVMIDERLWNNCREDSKGFQTIHKLKSLIKSYIIDKGKETNGIVL